MHLKDQSGVLALIRLLLGRGESGDSQLLGILQDFKHWHLSLYLYIYISTEYICMCTYRQLKLHSLPHSVTLLHIHLGQ